MNTTAIKLNRETSDFWTARLNAETTVNVQRQARGLYCVTYFKQGVVVDVETMRDGLANVALRLAEWMAI